MMNSINTSFGLNSRGVVRLAQLRFLLFALLLSSFISPVFAASSEVRHQVRAQFIYNFINYVEWPDDAFETPSSSMKICLYGDVPFSSYLLSFSGSLIGERALTFIISKALGDVAMGCHILYVGDDRRAELPTFWDQIKFVYVLSLGEQEGFSDNGGVVNIMRTQDKLEFDVNISNAMANGLFLDSDLLSLARVIKRNTKESRD